MITCYRGWTGIARIASIALLGLLGVACSTPPSFVGPADASTEAGPSNMKACSDLATAECSKLEGCSSTIMEIRYGSVATCEARQLAICMNALAAPSTGNTASKTEACVEAYASWACTDYFNNVNSPAACAQPTGDIALGQACNFPAQCVTGFCAVPPNAACGTCAAAPSPDDSCANLTSCGPGLLCLSSARVCGTYGVANATCSAAAPCGAHLSCIGAEATKGIPGRCEPSTPLIGGACDPTFVKGPGCDYDDGLVCNSKSRHCERLTVSPAHGPCDSNDSQYAACSTSGICTTTLPAATGVCVPAAPDGKGCSTASTGPGCLAPARCILSSGSSISGTCQVDTGTNCK
jgi:hypothetical protein